MTYRPITITREDGKLIHLPVVKIKNFLRWKSTQRGLSKSELMQAITQAIITSEDMPMLYINGKDGAAYQVDGHAGKLSCGTVVLVEGKHQFTEEASMSFICEEGKKHHA